MKISMTGQEKGDLLINRGDPMGRFDYLQNSIHF